MEFGFDQDKITRVWKKTKITATIANSLLWAESNLLIKITQTKNTQREQEKK